MMAGARWGGGNPPLQRGPGRGDPLVLPIDNPISAPII
jgi:hypothetical protein